MARLQACLWHILSYGYQHRMTCVAKLEILILVVYINAQEALLVLWMQGQCTVILITTVSVR